MDWALRPFWTFCPVVNDNQGHVRWVLRERGTTLARADPKIPLNVVPLTAISLVISFVVHLDEESSCKSFGDRTRPGPRPGFGNQKVSSLSDNGGVRRHFKATSGGRAI